MSVDELASRLPGRLRPDSARVITELFVPGHALPGGRPGRASAVVAHILALDDGEVDDTLESLMDRFVGRHRDLADAFSSNATRISSRLGAPTGLSAPRWLLLGAMFTHEYAVEAAALCNPCVVAAPDQSGASDGGLAFVMSVRQIGEGHRSSIGFRHGEIDRNGDIQVDEPGPFTTAGAVDPTSLEAAGFRDVTRTLQIDQDATDWALEPLGERFPPEELDARLTELEAQADVRRDVSETVHRLRELASRSYATSFPSSSRLDERVLCPATRAESGGLEDARFVRFADDDGAATYYATYTAYDGTEVVQQLLATTDFIRFVSSPLIGRATANKGMALFPRQVGGRYAALSRHDGARNWVAFSDDLAHWPDATSLDGPVAAWEAIQVGNCGSPIETEAGWLVLTHGVGPMRTYSIGAWLLDLEDPTRVIGRLAEPLITPRPTEQDGYVPNVVYSCGALHHEGTLLIPFGIGDATISLATVDLDELLSALTVEHRERRSG